MKLRHVAILFTALSLLSTASSCFGQAGSSARLTGQVLDQSGAATPNVSIEIEDLLTNTHRSARSSGEGYFSIDVLPPSDYQLTATAPGFSKSVVGPIRLSVNQTAHVDIVMKPGIVTETVTVDATAVALETGTSSLGSSVTENTVRQMPLLFRDPTQLITLVAGVTSDHRQEGASAPGSNLGGLSYQGRLSFEINGGMRALAVTMVDGVDVTISAGGFLSTPVQPTSDITQEFKVQTTNVPAEFGRGAGIVNIATRSGTNRFHGSAFEFLQNNVLDANSFFSNKAGQKLPHLERNQFGFAVGGPIRKDKTFFFVDSEWLKQANLDPISTQVPTAAQRAGDFSGLYGANGTPLTIFNPLSTITGANGVTVRNPFPNNQIPGNMLNAFAQKLLSFYPLPNNPGVLGPAGQYTGVGNYFVAGTQRSSYDRTDVKIDHNIGAQHKIMGRYSRDYYKIDAVNLFGNLAYPTSLSTRNNLQPGNNAVLSWNWIVSPSLVITQSANWSRIVDDSNSPSHGFDLTQLGGPFTDGSIQSFANRNSGGTTFPNVQVTGYSPMADGFGNNFSEPFSNYQYAAGIMKTVGKHTLKAGFQGILLQGSENLFKGYGTTMSFTGGFTCGPNPLVCSAFTGNGIADMLANTVDSGSMNAAFTSMYSGKYLAWYAQDDVRVTKHLTLNLGLRYDLNTSFTERYNHQFQFNRTVPNPIGTQAGPNTGGGDLNTYLTNLSGRPLLGGIAFPNSAGAEGRGIVPTDFSNWSPRLGAAYGITNKLVFRGGYSKLYLLSAEAPGPSSPGDGPFGATTSIVATVDGFTPNVTLGNPFPFGFLTPPFSSQGLASLLGTSVTVGSSSGKTPYQHQWSLGFQYQLSKDVVVSAAYVGTTAHQLQCPFFSCGDQVPASLLQKYGSQVVQSVPNPFYGIITDPRVALSAKTVQLGQLLKQWPQYSGVTFVLPAFQGPADDTFHSSFNALEVQGTKRYAGGLTVNAAFTWSKNLTNADAPDGGYLGPAAGYQNRYNYQGERSLAATDVPYRLSIGYVYDLPVGKGKAIGGSLSTPVNKVLGGWQVAGVTTFAGGYPLSISQTGQTTGAFGGTSRPDWVGNACYDNGPGRSRSDKISGWLNPAGFQHNPNFTFGDAPRTLPCRGDGIKNTDLSVIKVFGVAERAKIEFRGEFFNIFNRTRLGAPNTSFGGASFGVITGALNTPRIVQLGLKLNF